MSLEGLINHNGFYSEHYLAEVFVKDIGHLVAHWKARAEQAREVAETAAGGTALAVETASAITTPDLRLRDLRAGLADTLERLEASVRALAGRPADAAARSDIDRNGSVAMSALPGSAAAPCHATRQRDLSACSVVPTARLVGASALCSV